MKWKEFRRSENVAYSCLGATVHDDEAATRCFNEVDALRRDFAKKSAQLPQPLAHPDVVFDALMRGVSGSLGVDGNSGVGGRQSTRLSDDGGAKMKSDGDWQFRMQQFKELLDISLRVQGK